MSTFVNLVSKFFGSKSERDIKVILPIVEKVKEGVWMQRLVEEVKRIAG